MRPRQIAPVALVLGLTVAGVLGARALGDRDARSDSVHRADIAAAQIRERVGQGSSLTESLRRFVARGGAGATGSGFANNSSELLSPAGFPAAAWVEQVPAALRTAYERRFGHPIVTQDQAGRLVRVGSRSSYLPATLVSGVAPMVAPGIDLGSEPGIGAALTRASRLYDAGATPLATRPDGTKGLFLARFAPRLNRGIVEPGFVVVFVPELALRAAVTAAPKLRLTVGGASTGSPPGAHAARKTFTEAGQRFEVAVPREPVGGAAEVLPWIILGAGLVLAGLAAALGVNRARRAMAQGELNRIFNLSSDLIATADFEGHFTRVNPAVEQILGYTREEFIAKPYLELVHPDDRERTAAEAAAIAHGKTTLSFENRYVHKDGSFRVLEWTSTPVVEEGLMYGVARDVTERRQAQTELQRLAGEQAALRRVATLVALEASQAEIFGAIAEEIAGLLGTDEMRMLRYENEDDAVVLATSGAVEVFPVGARFPLEGENVAALVLRTGRPARIDDYRTASGPIAEAVRSIGVRCVVGTPILVEGKLWGAMVAASREDEPLPPDTETRLGQFTELIATAIANAEAHAEVERLADEQAALRRVATLVAQRVQPAELFASVTQEVARLFSDVDPSLVPSIIRFDPGPEFVLVGTSKPQYGLPMGSRWGLKDLYVSTRVQRSARSARVDEADLASLGGPDADLLRRQGFLYQVGSPIVVEGRLWGAMTINSGRALPPDADERLEKFTELVATAIANAESREALGQLADEQAALRRVATLVAEAAPPSDVFAAVAREVGLILSVDHAYVTRLDADDAVSVVAGWVGTGEPVQERLPLRFRAGPISDLIRETRRPTRLDPYPGDPGAEVLEHEFRSAVSAPITVEGRLWGFVTVASTTDEPPPLETEARLADFTELIATAISNAEARAEVERLADEQAALRRVAELVAREASQAEIFTAIAEEIARLLGTEEMRMLRYEGDRAVIVVASSGSLDAFAVGDRYPLEGENVTSLVFRTGEPARIEDYESASGPIAEVVRATGLHGVVGTPIMVEGRLWGAMVTATDRDQPLPPDTESRLGQFTELLATAIANAEARAEVERLADEQAALRRVATLVAQGASPSMVLDAVAAEMERLLGAAGVTLSRYEAGDEVTVVAHSGSGRRVPPGTRLSHRGENVASVVRRSERAARMEHRERTPSVLAEVARDVGVRASVGAPIVVEGGLWGVAIANWRGEESPPADTEERMAQFTEVLETAIANADSRDQLTASRARLLTEADEARRRLVRDLHDGAQQRLVHTIVTLKLAQRALNEGDGKAESLVGEALEQAEQGNAELRELAHGILPSVLIRGGLRAGVDTVVERLDLPVDVDIPPERFAAEIEASAYFIVAEALTNVIKHSRARSAQVRASVQAGMLHVEVRDDGTGGADPHGHGLVGMNDRVTALGGQLNIESPAGGGTLVAAALPLAQ